MLTHTFESSTSEYHKSTIHSNDSNEALVIGKPKKPKAVKKPKPGFLKKAMKVVADESKARKINSKTDYIKKPDLLKRKEQQSPNAVPHHLQEQQSSLRHSENEEQKQAFKLDTAFEKNFRNMEEKIKKLPRKREAQNYHYVATDDDFGAVEMLPKNRFAKRQEEEGPPVKHDQTLYRQFQ